jgi:large subunit ribosomal protein L31e
MAKSTKSAKTTKKGLEPTTRDTTIHLAKMTFKKTFKKRAPTALRRIKEFVQKVMLTKDVRIDSNLNKFVWSKGIKNLPTRVRVRMSRRRNEDEDATEKMYTLVQHIPVESFEGLQTEVVADE